MMPTTQEDWKCPGGGGNDYCNEKPGRQPRDEGDDLGF